MFFDSWLKSTFEGIYTKLSKLDEGEGIGGPELYVGVLLFFNTINKYSPGKWVNPPTREEVFKLLETFDRNDDKRLSKEEFAAFCKKFLPDVTKKVMRDLLVAFAITPFIIWAIIHRVTFIKKILPEAVFGAIFVAILQAVGAFRFLDTLLDMILPTTAPPPPRPATRPGQPNPNPQKTE